LAELRADGAPSDAKTSTLRLLALVNLDRNQKLKGFDLSGQHPEWILAFSTSASQFDG
jgi:hypothetical protein